MTGWSSCVLGLVAVVGCRASAGSPPGHRLQSPEVRAALAEETASVLARELEAWYPRAVDRERGGFLSRFDHAWEPVGDQDKLVVTQARHTWTAAQAAMWTGDSAYHDVALHGVAFLRDAMWDAEHGGFHWLVRRDGTPRPEADGRTRKRAYGLAFGIYGLAAAHEATGDVGALRLARRAFRWLDAHAHDPEHGGYFSLLTPEGEPFRGALRYPRAKDQNASLHLLEAFTALYRVWPDPTLRDRLEEMLVLLRDTMVVAPGTLAPDFRADWTPLSEADALAWVRLGEGSPDHRSPGHDVEAAALMLDAADALGLDPAPTLAVAKRLVDQSLRAGWDDVAGGFVETVAYPEGGATGVVVDPARVWWAQAEGLHALLLLGDRFPDDPMRYHDRFLQLWGSIQAYLVDHERGGWYPGSIDLQPEMRRADKGHVLKGGYHTARALLGVTRRLRGAGPATGPEGGEAVR